jgi:ABC-type phosphate transport system substrate-binding protein
MYNLTINGERVTNLRLSGENIAKIFTGVITMWNDPAIVADNPGLTLPARTIVPVVRSDGSGSTAHFTEWMVARHGAIWNDFCHRTGRSACGMTSQYPVAAGTSMISAALDSGVAGYISHASNEGTIGYVIYSYALNTYGFPVAKVLNAAGYHTEPTPENVAVSLLNAVVIDDPGNPALHLTQQLDGVYASTDKRNYELSSYSYFILPTKTSDNFTDGKGRTLGAFAYYAMCEAQQQSASLGYSPIPINLVLKSLEQIRLIPGVEVQNIDIATCNNPTFSPGDSVESNALANNAPQPQECDRQGPYQCPDGTAGMRNVPTTILAQAVLGVGDGGDQSGGDGNGGAGGESGGGGGADAGGVVAGGDDGDGQAGGATPGGPNAGSGSTASSGRGTTGSEASTTGGAGTDDGTSAGGAPAGSASAAATDSALGGSGSTSGSADSNAAGNAQQMAAQASNCDADTGLCGGAAAGTDARTSGGAEPAAAQAVGVITPVTLEPESRWRTASLALLVIALTVALVLAPSFAWRYFSREAPG